MNIQSNNIVINKSTSIKQYQLMHMDIPLININEDNGKIEVMKDNTSFLPYALRKNDLNFENIKAWASRRVLLLDRENAKTLLNACDLPQDDKYQVARVCRFISVDDCFWLRENDSEKWDDFNLRKNSLSNAVSQIALNGEYISLSGEITTPEFTTLGTYPKAWKREDGGLYLYKKSLKNHESEKEILVSEILDLLNIEHIKYLKTDEPDICKCKCMADDEKSRLSFGEYQIYCKNNGIDAYQSVLEQYPIDFMKMAVIDYIIANMDRHGGNWGFWIDNKTGKITGLHPLYDHNISFDGIGNEYYRYTGLKTTVKELAVQAEKELKLDLSPLQHLDEKMFDSYNISYSAFQKRIRDVMTPDIVLNILKDKSIQNNKIDINNCDETENHDDNYENIAHESNVKGGGDDSSNITNHDDNDEEDWNI